MIKIGILTYFWGENPGTFMQAYSLQEAFKDRFPNAQVELINYRHRWNYFKPSLGRVTAIQVIKDFKKYMKYRKLRNKLLAAKGDILITRNSESAWKFIEKQKYDLVVIGSDTILQFLNFHFLDNKIPVYWLPPYLSCKKVLCAASAGTLTYEQLGGEKRNILHESINNFDFLGVRDDATFYLMQKLGVQDKTKLKMVPDPTFTYGIDNSYIEKIAEDKKIDFSKPTILFSLLREFKLSKQLYTYYKQKGFQVLSIKPTKNADICLTDITPFEWAGLFGKVKLVFTQSFHDTLFSLKNHTPVITIVSSKKVITESGLSKYYSLLKQYNLHETNYYNAIGIDDASGIIKKADNVMNSFNPELIKQKNGCFRDEFNLVMNEIAGLFV